MAGSSYVGAYWGARRELVEACAARLRRCLVMLADIDPALGTWYGGGNSRADALRHPVDTSEPALRERLLDGRNRGDENNEVIEDLGFSAGMWNGAADGEAVGVTVACGAYPPVNTVGNSVVVRFPAAADGTRDYYKPGTGRAVLEALVECWEPDWAAWTTFEMSKAQGKPRGVRLGWLTYLSPGRRVSPGQIPPPARAEPFHGGTIITIGDPPEPVSGECLNQLREALEDALAP